MGVDVGGHIISKLESSRVLSCSVEVLRLLALVEEGSFCQKLYIAMNKILFFAELTSIFAFQNLQK